MNIFADLNPIQKEAVETTNGPLLILAGAGTGKTKVITTRIVNILERNLATKSEILAVTFTNKAAKEMKDRIEKMLNYSIDGFWIGTFHSIGLRILRRHYNEVGLNPNFSILDMEDCEKIIKQILIEKNIDTKKYSPSSVSNMISKLKDKNIFPDSLPSEENKTIGSVKLSDIYLSYASRLRELNSVDFADLLLLCVDLFRQFPDILQQWQSRFKYIMVDEYQDTNTLQYLFIRVLAIACNNICCVGDDDQSIYSWRGAEIANILRFDKDFPGAKVLRLEQNYRSTTPILKVASSVIAKNPGRWKKQLWTDKVDEETVKLYEAFNSKQEADFVATTINELLKKGARYEHSAVLFRATFQSREIEERFLYHAIPYKFVGGSRFYDRMEIKDVVAYLRLLYQSYDDMAFLRIINIPKRGIGESSIDKIREYAKNNSLSLYNAASNIISKKILSAKVENELNIFVEGFESWKNALLNSTLADIAKKIVNESGYMFMWENEKSEDAKSRIDNIKELFVALGNFNSLEDFLEHVSLVSDKEEEKKDNKVTLITLHGAKGLEFNTVFLVGWEEGLLPNQRSIEESGDLGLEEERRLAYVGITRAKQRLYISYSKNRQMYGSWQPCVGSRFINELDMNFIEKINADNYAYKNAMQDSFLKKALYAEKETDYPVYENKVSPIKIGMLVTHTTMGKGEVTALQGPIATVNFHSGGMKKIMISFLSAVHD